MKSRNLGLFAGAAFFGMSSTFANATVVYQTDFESGALGSEWTTSTSTPDGRVGVSNVFGAPANSGSFHLAMDTAPAGAGVLNLNEAILTLDLSGLTGVQLSFWHKDVNDEDQSLPSSFSGSANGDGVSFSVDGSTWYTLTSLSDANSPNLVYTGFMFDLDAAAVSAGVTLGSSTSIKFQQYDNFPFGADGRTFDDVVVSANAVPAPPTLALLSLGLTVIGYRRQKRIKAA